MDVLTHTAHDAGLEGGTLQPLVNGACAYTLHTCNMHMHMHMHMHKVLWARFLDAT